MTPETLADLIHTSHVRRSGRLPPLLPVQNTTGTRGRVSTLDLQHRLRARKIPVGFDELRAALDELVRRGVLARGDGGYAVATLEALGAGGHAHDP